MIAAVVFPEAIRQEFLDCRLLKGLGLVFCGSKTCVVNEVVVIDRGRAAAVMSQAVCGNFKVHFTRVVKENVSHVIVYFY